MARRIDRSDEAGKRLDNRPVVRLAQEFFQAFHQLGPDALEDLRLRRLAAALPGRILLLYRALLLTQRRPLRTHQLIQAAEVPREDASDLFADARNTERKNETRQRTSTGPANCPRHVLGRFSAHAFQLLQLSEKKKNK